MVAFAEHKLPAALDIAMTLEADLYRVCRMDGLAAACIDRYWPAMTADQIAEIMMNTFASELLPSIDSPSAEFNAIAKAAFRTAPKRAIDDTLAQTCRTAKGTKEHEDEQ